MIKTRESFNCVKDFVCDLYPEMDNIKLHHCKDAEKDHGREWRVFAHMNHVDDAVCYSDAMEELSEEQRQGIFLHEFGHMLCELYKDEFPENSDDDADGVILDEFDVQIFYDKRDVEIVLLPLEEEDEEIIEEERKRGSAGLTGRFSTRNKTEPPPPMRQNSRKPGLFEDPVVDTAFE